MEASTSFLGDLGFMVQLEREIITVETSSKMRETCVPFLCGGVDVVAFNASFGTGQPKRARLFVDFPEGLLIGLESISTRKCYPRNMRRMMSRRLSMGQTTMDGEEGL